MFSFRPVARILDFQSTNINRRASFARNPLFQMELPATPRFRSNIGDGFGEIPAMPVKILGIVLALSIRMPHRFAQNDGPVPSRAFAVADGIFNSYLHTLRMVGHYISFANGKAALPGFHLDTVIGNT